MRLSTKGRYAVNAMLDLAFNENSKPINLNAISNRQNISLSYLEQLFAQLRKASLVKGVKGPGGGYLLKSNAKDITLGQIIYAVEENIDIRSCKGAKNCLKGDQCLTHNLWSEFGVQISNFLNNKNLQQIIDDYNYKKNNLISYRKH